MNPEPDTITTDDSACAVPTFSLYRSWTARPLDTMSAWRSRSARTAISSIVVQIPSVHAVQWKKCATRMAMRSRTLADLPSAHCVKQALSHLSDLEHCTEQDLLALHGFGPKALRILRQALAEQGLSFAKK